MRMHFVDKDSSYPHLQCGKVGGAWVGGGGCGKGEFVLQTVWDIERDRHGNVNCLALACADRLRKRRRVQIPAERVGDSDVVGIIRIGEVGGVEDGVDVRPWSALNIHCGCDNDNDRGRPPVGGVHVSADIIFTGTVRITPPVTLSLNRIGLTQLEVPGLVVRRFIAVQTRNGFDTLRYSTRRNCATTNLLRKSYRNGRTEVVDFCQRNA